MSVPRVEILPLNGIDARYEPMAWDFMERHRAEIDALWARTLAEKPHLFNGTVLMQHRWSIRDGVYEADYAPVDYASFTAWSRLGKPGAARRNGFAMAALRAADGPFILGVMGKHTFNAGTIYFAGGTPDMGDVTADGQVDLTGSMLRELLEETGLREDEVIVSPDWTLVLDGHRAAFLREARLLLPAKEAVDVIRARLALQIEPELADVVTVGHVSKIDRGLMPAFAAAYLERALS